MVGEINQNVFFIQKDASSFAEFEISRVDCMASQQNVLTEDFSIIFKLYLLVAKNILLISVTDHFRQI